MSSFRGTNSILDISDVKVPDARRVQTDNLWKHATRIRREFATKRHPKGRLHSVITFSMCFSRAGGVQGPSSEVFGHGYHRRALKSQSNKSSSTSMSFGPTDESRP
jgi:hypothetical protein